jgi:hypothetical protein
MVAVPRRVAVVAWFVALFGSLEGFVSAMTEVAERSGGFQRFFGWAVLAGLAGIWLLLDERIPSPPAEEARVAKEERSAGLSREEVAEYQAAKARMAASRRENRAPPLP